MYQLGWFSTARGPGSRELLRAAWEAIQRGELEAQIAYVFCNRERGESPETDAFLDQVESYGVPLVALSFSKFRREHEGRGMGFDGSNFAPWRESYDKAAANTLRGYSAELAVLAGYMLVMSPALGQAFPFINMHPAAPGGPVGTWQQVIWQLIDQRAEESGIFMHAATPELDLGPVATYCRYSLRTPALEPLWAALGDASSKTIQAAQGEEHPLFKAIRQEGATRELPFILATLKAFCSSGLAVRDYQVIDNGGRAVTAMALTEQVETALGVWPKA